MKSAANGRCPASHRLQLYAYVAAALVLLFDQAAKLAAIRLLKPVGSVPLVGDYVSLTWATNTGGAFGIMATSTFVLAMMAVAVLAVLVAVTRRMCTSRLMAVALALLMGGALGNLIDRLRLGYVVDFIDVHFWPIFNIADIAITVGAGLLIIATLVGADPRGRPDTHTEDD